MGASLDSKTRICGYPITLFKRVLTAYGRAETPERLIDLKSLFSFRRDGAIIFEECVSRSLIDPKTLELTAAGAAIARAKCQPRSPLLRADALIEQFLDRAEAMNRDPEAIHQVDEIWLFGSVTRREATVSDIDLAVRSSRKPHFRDDHHGRHRHAEQLIERVPDAPREWRSHLHRETWLRERYLFGRRRHPLLSGAQDDTDDLAALGTPCRLIFDRYRGGRVDDPVLERHPDSAGRDADCDPPVLLPDLRPSKLEPMDGRWLAGYSPGGRVSPQDIFRGQSEDAHRLFAEYSGNLRIAADGADLPSFPWVPRRLQWSGIDGHSLLLIVDATATSGMSLVLGRRLTTSGRTWKLDVRLRDLEFQGSGVEMATSHAASIVGAVSLLLAVDAEHMVRRANELGQKPKINIKIGQPSRSALQALIVDPVIKKLRSRAIRIEPVGWAHEVEIRTG